MQKQQSLDVHIGFATTKGRRDTNQDYVAFFKGTQKQTKMQGIVAAVSDGMGGHKGGREAAELTIRSFIDGYYALPPTLGVQKVASKSLEAINAWIFAQGRADPKLQNMGTTFSSLIFHRRSAYALHIGDSRIYKISEGRLEQLTKDHTLGKGDYSHVLTRAIGLEDYARVDHLAHFLRPRDRFLICSDGVHGVLNNAKIADLLQNPLSPEDTAQHIVEAALNAGSTDNVSALVADIIDLPPLERSDIFAQIENLPILDLPDKGDNIDDYILGDMISDGQYSRVFRVADNHKHQELVFKFPHPKVATDQIYKLAFTREAYVAARVRSPWIGEIIEPAIGKQTRLYSIMPYYEGETLEQRLKHEPKLSLEEISFIAIKLARAVLTLHRVGIIHRDIKPENIILELGKSDKTSGLRLVDLGVARVPKMDDFATHDIPGTPSYMAPELFAGEMGNEASDQYALGVTIYRSLTGAYPYGEVEPFSNPRFNKPTPLSKYRPDLPSWLDLTLARAIAVNPQNRFGDVIEFAIELENGAVWNKPPISLKKSLYDRNPLVFWKLLSVGLFLGLVASFALR
jgi:serine/threonine protein phosphatase PrpC